MVKKEEKKSNQGQTWKLVYLPQRDYDALDQLAKATNDKKSYILREGMLLYAEKKMEKNPVFKRAKEYLEEIKKKIERYEQTMSHLEDKIDALWKAVENLRKKV